jgi:hypothetical protein
MSLSGADGSTAVQMCLDLATLGNVDGLLDLVPDSIVEEAIKWKQRARLGSFHVVRYSLFRLLEVTSQL